MSESAREDAADRDVDQGVESKVTQNQGASIIEVEIIDDVDAHIRGEKTYPGERVFVDGPCAIHLVTQGHAQIVGSRSIEAAEKDDEAWAAEYAKFVERDAKAAADETKREKAAADKRATARKAASK